MFCATSETKGNVDAVKHVSAPSNYSLTVLLWFSVACFGVGVSATFQLIFHHMCVHIILVRLGCCVATFWERAVHSVDHMSVLYFTICYFSYFRFRLLGLNLGTDCFSSWTCIPFTFAVYCLQLTTCQI